MNSLSDMFIPSCIFISSKFSALNVDIGLNPVYIFGLLISKMLKWLFAKF